MAQEYGQFYVQREILDGAMKIPGEQILKTYGNMQFEDASKSLKKQVKIAKLDLQLTSHRLILNSKQNNWLAFAVDLGKVINIKAKSGGFFGMGNSIKHLNFYFDNTKAVKIRIVGQSNDLKDIQARIPEANKKRKQIDQQQQELREQEQKRNQMYKGTKGLAEDQRNQIGKQENKFKSSMGGDIGSLMEHAAELKGIIDYIKAHSQSFKQENNNEMNQLLDGIGCFDIVTKDDAGKNYTNQLSQQIYNEICLNLFDNYGGIIPLLDVFYFYNKRRGGMNYISAKEVEEACQNFQKIGIKAKVMTYENNIKVIESLEYDVEKDFDKDIGKYIDNNGITPEELSKKLTQEKLKIKKTAGAISPLIARIKLNRAQKAGKIVIDDRIEGARYFKNCILLGF